MLHYFRTSEWNLVFRTLSGHVRTSRKTLFQVAIFVSVSHQRTRLARIHAVKSSWAQAYLQSKQKQLLVDLSEEVTVHANCVLAELLLLRDLCLCVLLFFTFYYISCL